MIPIRSVTDLENSPEGPMTYHTLGHVANGLQGTYITHKFSTEYLFCYDLIGRKKLDRKGSIVCNTIYVFFLSKYLFCLPISPINASHYDMTWLGSITIDYNIFNVLHCYQAKTN